MNNVSKITTRKSTNGDAGSKRKKHLPRKKRAEIHNTPFTSVNRAPNRLFKNFEHP